MSVTDLVTITLHRVENAYRNCQEQQKNGNYRYAERGMRAVRDKNRLVMLALEKVANLMRKITDEQYGQSKHGRDVPYSHTVDPTETQLFIKAYELADKGTPIEEFKWIYGAVTEIALDYN